MQPAATITKSTPTTATLEHRPIQLQVLSDNLKAELIEAAKRGQAGRGESRMRHVEVFRMGSVRTSILRETSTPTAAMTHSTDYTLVREEPAILADTMIPEAFEGRHMLTGADHSCRVLTAFIINSAAG